MSRRPPLHLHVSPLQLQLLLQQSSLLTHATLLPLHPLEGPVVVVAEGATVIEGASLGAKERDGVGVPEVKTPKEANHS